MVILQIFPYAIRYVLDDRTRWNNHLFSAIASSYAIFLLHARTYYLKPRYNDWEEDLNKYYNLFPRLSVDDRKDLPSIIFRHLLESNAEILCVFTLIKENGQFLSVEWHPLSSPTDQVHYWLDTPDKELHLILQDIGLKITLASEDMVEAINCIVHQLDEDETKIISAVAVHCGRYQ